MNPAIFLLELAVHNSVSVQMCQLLHCVTQGEE